SIELQSTSNPAHRKDLVVRLTDDTDPFFLYNLVISEEDFQSLKFQQCLLVDFSAFPQRFIDLLQQCIQEQNKDIPRFLLQLVSSASVLDHTPASLNVVETNPFKHLTHLSLKLLPGNDAEIKKFLAICLKCIKKEKLLLEEKLKKTEDDLARQLNYTQQSLVEKSRELDKLRNEWTSHTTSLTNKHTQEITNEREKTLHAQTQYHQQHEQQKRELESLHQRTVQQLQSRLTELEIANKDLTERRYKGDSTIRELKAKLSGIEDECQRAKQEVLSLRRENTTLDAECHEKEKHINQLKTRVAVLEQEIKDKDQIIIRTKEVLDATQEQKATMEENTEKKQVQMGKLEATVKSLSSELLKANEIINKLQGDLKTLMSKLKLKNTVTIQQEKLLAELQEKLQKEQRELQDAGHSLRAKDQEVCKLQEQLETTVEKLEESKQLLKTNENVITWLNKQLNEIQMSKKQEALGTSTTPPMHTSNGSIRIGISPYNMLPPPPVISCSGGGVPWFAHYQLLEGTLRKRSSPSVPWLHHYTGLSRAWTWLGIDQWGMGGGLSGRAVLYSKIGEHLGLETKYLKKREDSIPLRGLSQNMFTNSGRNGDILAPMSSKPTIPSTASAYFPG
uniref:Spindle assembly abnormal protein 6 homolog n=1 Tax=Sphenodon punctatus TaxID=8508 RepID=A0A8D0HME9_SPHPU